MAKLRNLLKSTCESDAALADLLTGGWFIADDLPQGGMTPDDAPRSTNGVTILPFGVIRLRASNMVVPLISGEAGSVEMYLYQDRGFDVIEQAITRLASRDLFHRVNLYPDNRAGVYMQVAFISDPLPDPDMGHAPMQFIRFALSQIR